MNKTFKRGITHSLNSGRESTETVVGFVASETDTVEA